MYFFAQAFFVQAKNFGTAGKKKVIIYLGGKEMRIREVDYLKWFTAESI